MIFGRHADGSMDVIHGRSSIALADAPSAIGDNSSPFVQATVINTTCPDGTIVTPPMMCPAVQTSSTTTGGVTVTCWDGSKVPVGNPCPPGYRCPNGSIETDLSHCAAQGVATYACSDGSRVTDPAMCPPPWYLQWYVLYPAIGVAAYFLWGVIKPKASNPVLSGLLNFGKRKR